MSRPSTCDLEEAVRRTPDELVDALAASGTPEECVEKIHRDIVEPGVGHLMMMIADPGLAVAGTHGNVPDIRDQLTLITDRVRAHRGVSVASEVSEAPGSATEIS